MANPFDQFEPQGRFGAPGTTVTDRAEGIYSDADVNVRDPKTNQMSKPVEGFDEPTQVEKTPVDTNPFDQFEQGNPFDQFSENKPKDSPAEYMAKKLGQGAVSTMGGISFVAGGLAGLFGADETSDKLFSNYEKTTDFTGTKLETDDQRQKGLTRLGGAVSSAIPALAGFLINPVTGLTTMMAPSFADAGTNTKAGLSGATTAAILGIDALANVLGFKLPGGVGGSIGKKVLSGIGINVGMGAGADAAKNKVASLEDKELAEKYDPTNFDARIADALFGTVAGASHSNKTSKPTIKVSDILDEIDAPVKERTEAEPVNPATANFTPDDFANMQKQTAGMELEPKTEKVEPPAKVDDGTIDFEKVDIGEVPRERQDTLDLGDQDTIDFKKFASPEHARDFVQTLENDLTPTNKGEPGQMDLPGINSKNGFNKKQGGYINPAILREGVESLIKKFKPEGVLNAFKGTFSPKAVTEMRDVINDPNSKDSVVWMKPKDFLSLADQRPSNFEEGYSEKKRDSVRQGLKTEEGLKDGLYLSVDDKGNVLTHNGRHRMDVLGQQGLDLVPVRIKNLPKDAPIDFLTPQKNAKNQDKIMLGDRIEPTKPLGGTGKKGFGQGGAVDFGGLFGKKEPSLEDSAKTLSVQEWTAKFLKQYPQYEDRPEVAAQVYDRLNPQGEEKFISLRDMVDNSKTLKGLDKLLGSSSTRIGNINKSVLHRTLRYEKELLQNTHKKISVADTFLHDINRLPENTQKVVNNLLLNNNTEALNKTLSGLGRKDLVDEYANIRTMLDDVGADLQQVGRLDHLRQEYFPRMVKDVKGLLGALDAPFRGALEVRLKEAREKALDLGKDFTSAEESKIINDYLRARTTQNNKPGFSKERKLGDVAPDLEKFYATPTEGLHSYIRNAVSEIETAKFFGKEGVKDPSTGKLDVDKSIGEITAKEIRDGKMSVDQAVELESILKSRFGPGNQSSSSFVQGFKDLSSMGLLGSVTSAITQGGDVFASAYMNGFRPTLMSLVAQARGRQKVSMKDFGLVDHISQEFVSQRTSSKVLNKLFDKTGFALIDRIGKTTLLDSTIRSAEKAVNSPEGLKKFENQWKEKFGDEYPELVEDLKAGKRTELTDMLAFSQLSKVQPISKIEQSQTYLNSPNGRLFYMLKTFMLKQLDLVRNDSYNEIKKGNVKEGLGNLLRYSLIMGSAGATTDYIKNWILGRDVNPKLSDVPMNVLKIFGINEYNMKRAADGQPLDAIAKSVIPPYQMWDNLVKESLAAIDEDKEVKGTFLNYVPWVGNILYNRYYGGADKYDENQEAKN